jgi:hypothetical protein
VSTPIRPRPTRPARARRTGAALAAAALLLGTAACSSGAAEGPAGASGAGGTGGDPSPTASSGSPSGSPSGSATGSALPTAAASGSTSPAPSATAQVAVPRLAGYTYGEVPDVFAAIGDGFRSSGTVDGIATRGVYKGKQLVAVALVADYTDAVTKAMDEVPATTIASAVASAKSGLGDDVEERTIDVEGVTLELLTSSDGLSVGIAYIPGGSLVEVYGPAAGGVTDVSTKLVAALV